MTLSGFNSTEEFTSAHATGFKNAIADTLSANSEVSATAPGGAVQANQVHITSVAMASRRLVDWAVHRAQHAGYGRTGRRRLGSTAVSVTYEVDGLTTSASAAVSSSIAAVASDPSAFTTALSSSFASAGADTPFGWGVTAASPEVYVFFDATTNPTAQQQDVMRFECNNRQGCRAYCWGSDCTVRSRCGTVPGHELQTTNGPTVSVDANMWSARATCPEGYVALGLASVDLKDTVSGPVSQDIRDIDCNSEGCRVWCWGSGCKVSSRCARIPGQNLKVTAGPKVNSPRDAYSPTYATCPAGYAVIGLASVHMVSQAPHISVVDAETIVAGLETHDLNDFECNAKGCRAWCSGTDCELRAMCAAFPGYTATASAQETQFYVTVDIPGNYSVCYFQGPHAEPLGSAAQLQIMPAASVWSGAVSSSGDSPSEMTGFAFNLSSHVATDITIRGTGLSKADVGLAIIDGAAVTCPAVISPRALSSKVFSQNLVSVAEDGSSATYNLQILSPNDEDAFTMCYSLDVQADVTAAAAAAAHHGTYVPSGPQSTRKFAGYSHLAGTIYTKPAFRIDGLYVPGARTSEAAVTSWNIALHNLDASTTSSKGASQAERLHGDTVVETNARRWGVLPGASDGGYSTSMGTAGDFARWHPTPSPSVDTLDVPVLVPGEATALVIAGAGLQADDAIRIVPTRESSSVRLRLSVDIPGLAVGDYVGSTDPTVGIRLRVTRKMGLEITAVDVGSTEALRVVSTVGGSTQVREYTGSSFSHHRLNGGIATVLSMPTSEAVVDVSCDGVSVSVHGGGRRRLHASSTTRDGATPALDSVEEFNAGLHARAANFDGGAHVRSAAGGTGEDLAEAVASTTDDLSAQPLAGAGLPTAVIASAVAPGGSRYTTFLVNAPADAGAYTICYAWGGDAATSGDLNGLFGTRAGSIVVTPNAAVVPLNPATDQGATLTARAPTQISIQGSRLTANDRIVLIQHSGASGADCSSTVSSSADVAIQNSPLGANGRAAEGGAHTGVGELEVVNGFGVTGAADTWSPWAKCPDGYEVLGLGGVTLRDVDRGAGAGSYSGVAASEQDVTSFECGDGGCRAYCWGSDCTVHSRCARVAGYTTQTTNGVPVVSKANQWSALATCPTGYIALGLGSARLLNTVSGPSKQDIRDTDCTSEGCRVWCWGSGCVAASRCVKLASGTVANLDVIVGANTVRGPAGAMSSYAECAPGFAVIGLASVRMVDQGSGIGGHDLNDFECNAKGCRAWCSGTACDVTPMCAKFPGYAEQTGTAATFMVAVDTPGTYSVCYRFGLDGGFAASAGTLAVVAAATIESLSPGAAVVKEETEIIISGSSLSTADDYIIVKGSSCNAHFSQDAAVWEIYEDQWLNQHFAANVKLVEDFNAERRRLHEKTTDDHAAGVANFEGGSHVRSDTGSAEASTVHPSTTHNMDADIVANAKAVSTTSKVTPRCALGKTCVSSKVKVTDLGTYSVCYKFSRASAYDSHAGSFTVIAARSLSTLSLTSSLMVANRPAIISVRGVGLGAGDQVALVKGKKCPVVQDLNANRHTNDHGSTIGNSLGQTLAGEAIAGTAVIAQPLHSSTDIVSVQWSPPDFDPAPVDVPKTAADYEAMWAAFDIHTPIVGLSVGDYIGSTDHDVALRLQVKSIGTGVVNGLSVANTRIQAIDVGSTETIRVRSGLGIRQSEGGSAAGLAAVLVEYAGKQFLPTQALGASAQVVRVIQDHGFYADAFDQFVHCRGVDGDIGIDDRCEQSTQLWSVCYSFGATAAAAGHPSFTTPAGTVTVATAPRTSSLATTSTTVSVPTTLTINGKGLTSADKISIVKIVGTAADTCATAKVLSTTPADSSSVTQNVAAVTDVTGGYRAADAGVGAGLVAELETIDGPGASGSAGAWSALATCPDGYNALGLAYIQQQDQVATTQQDISSFECTDGGCRAYCWGSDCTVHSRCGKVAGYMMQTTNGVPVVSDAGMWSALATCPTGYTALGLGSVELNTVTGGQTLPTGRAHPVALSETASGDFVGQDIRDFACDPVEGCRVRCFGSGCQTASRCAKLTHIGGVATTRSLFDIILSDVVRSPADGWGDFSYCPAGYATVGLGSVQMVSQHSLTTHDLNDFKCNANGCKVWCSGTDCDVRTMCARANQHESTAGASSTFLVTLGSAGDYAVCYHFADLLAIGTGSAASSSGSLTAALGDSNAFATYAGTLKALPASVTTSATVQVTQTTTAAPTPSSGATATGNTPISDSGPISPSVVQSAEVTQLEVTGAGLRASDRLLLVDMSWLESNGYSTSTNACLNAGEFPSQAQVDAAAGKLLPPVRPIAATTTKATFSVTVPASASSGGAPRRFAACYAHGKRGDFSKRVAVVTVLSPRAVTSLSPTSFVSGERANLLIGGLSFTSNDKLHILEAPSADAVEASNVPCSVVTAGADGAGATVASDAAAVFMNELGSVSATSSTATITRGTDGTQYIDGTASFGVGITVPAVHSKSNHPSTTARKYHVCYDFGGTATHVLLAGVVEVQVAPASLAPHATSAPTPASLAPEQVVVPTANSEAQPVSSGRCRHDTKCCSLSAEDVGTVLSFDGGYTYRFPATDVDTGPSDGPPMPTRSMCVAAGAGQACVGTVASCLIKEWLNQPKISCDEQCRVLTAYPTPLPTLHEMAHL
jgi:hypothetical protein